MAKIIKSEFLGPEHPIFKGEWTISSHRKRTPEQEEKYVEFMNIHKNWSYAESN